MKPRSPEELAAIEKAMEDPRGAALSMFTLAAVVGSDDGEGPVDYAGTYIVDRSAAIVDALFDRLAALDRAPEPAKPEPEPAPVAQKRCDYRTVGEIDIASQIRKAYRCIRDAGHSGTHAWEVIPFTDPEHPEALLRT